MKKLLVFILIIVVAISSILIGVSVKNRIVKKTVSEYLQYASNLEWDEAKSKLTGEALAETMKNSGSVKDRETISKKKMSACITGNLAVVDADITKTGNYDNRVLYRFKLIKIDSGWKIYKVGYKQFERPRYLFNSRDSGMNVVNEYLGLNYIQRSESAEKYLAGEALVAALRNRILPKDNIPDIKEKVISLKPIGSNGDISTIEAVIEVENNQEITALIDTVKVKDAWKIINIEVVK